MDEITPTIDTTKEEIEKRIKYMVDTADYLDELSKTSLQQAKKGFSSLKNFSERENHILNLVKNVDVVRNNEYLKRYRNFFAHLHFTVGRVTNNNLHSNLDEFHQAERYCNFYV